MSGSFAILDEKMLRRVRDLMRNEGHRELWNEKEDVFEIICSFVRSILVSSLVFTFLVEWLLGRVAACPSPSIYSQWDVRSYAATLATAIRKKSRRALRIAVYFTPNRIFMPKSARRRPSRFPLHPQSPPTQYSNYQLTNRFIHSAGFVSFILVRCGAVRRGGARVAATFSVGRSESASRRNCRCGSVGRAAASRRTHPSSSAALSLPARRFGHRHCRSTCANYPPLYYYWRLDERRKMRIIVRWYTRRGEARQSKAKQKLKRGNYGRMRRRPRSNIG